ncbi:unnamed protein product, partial [Discosporangium mesarthrocarpum]
ESESLQTIPEGDDEDDEDTEESLSHSSGGSSVSHRSIADISPHMAPGLRSSLHVATASAATTAKADPARLTPRSRAVHFADRDNIGPQHQGIDATVPGAGARAGAEVGAGAGAGVENDCGTSRSTSPSTLSAFRRGLRLDKETLVSPFDYSTPGVSPTSTRGSAGIEYSGGPGPEVRQAMKDEVEDE